MSLATLGRHPTNLHLLESIVCGVQKAGLDVEYLLIDHFTTLYLTETCTYVVQRNPEAITFKHGALIDVERRISYPEPTFGACIPASANFILSAHTNQSESFSCVPPEATLQVPLYAILPSSDRTRRAPLGGDM